MTAPERPYEQRVAADLRALAQLAEDYTGYRPSA